MKKYQNYVVKTLRYCYKSQTKLIKNYNSFLNKNFTVWCCLKAAIPKFAQLLRKFFLFDFHDKTITNSKESKFKISNFSHYFELNWAIRVYLRIKKTKIEQLLSKYQQGNDIHDMKNSKTNEQHIFALSLSERSDLKSSIKHVALQKLSIYYT